MIQRRAVRFVTNTYGRNTSPTEIIKYLDWVPLRERRAKNKVNILYKGRDELIHIPMNHLQVNTRKEAMYRVPSSRIDSHLYSFHPSTIRLWNGLPPEVKALPTVTAFSERLKNFTICCSYGKD